MNETTTDVRGALDALLRRAIGEAIGAEYAATDPMLRRSTHADFQANCALALQKATKRKPREIAEQIVKALTEGAVSADAKTMLARVDIAGPGFLNLQLENTFLCRALAAQLEDPRLGVKESASPEVVVIDYSSPNAAKEMHVGHLRSTVIGDALRRVLAFRGHRVVAQNHLGDWGTPFGMLIEHLLDADAGEESDASALTKFYKAARKKFDTDPTFAERARARVVLLQAGDDATLKYWTQLVDESRKYMAKTYARLGVLLEDKDIAGESKFNAELAPLAKELEERGLAKMDEGALCMFPPGFQNREGNPMGLMVRKRDGGFGYGATDLAALRHRIQNLRGTRILYVVGSPQAQHLSMVHRAGEMAGWVTPGVRAEHVQFGSVLGDDNKMLKTRDGETVRLSSLLEEGEARARETIVEKRTKTAGPAKDQEEEAGEELFDEGDLDAVAHAITIAAIKYADLSSDRIKDYTFEWSRMLADKGNTGVYLLYATARLRSIVRKGEETIDGSAIRIEAPAERALALALVSFAEVLTDVETALEPHRLCTYLYELASAVAAFYNQCQVLKAPDAATRSSRLAQCELSSRVLTRGLDLLGITALDRM